MPPRSKKDSAQPASDDKLVPLFAMLSELSSGITSQLPGEMQIRVDVHVCLLDAITDRFPVVRSAIEAGTVPSKNPISADAQGWGICLATFAGYLHNLRPVYSFYDHRPAYTQATLDKPISEIVPYLVKSIVDQSKGLGG